MKFVSFMTQFDSTCGPSSPFITSILELKLDAGTNFEWQKFSQDLPGYPHYRKLLEFLNLRAQASEASTNEGRRNLPRGDDSSKKGVNKPIAAFVATTHDPSHPNPH